MPRLKRKIPVYDQVYPPELATPDTLRAEGRQPALGQVVVALFRWRSAGVDRTSALYARADTVLLKPEETGADGADTSTG